MAPRLPHVRPLTPLHDSFNCDSEIMSFIATQDDAPIRATVPPPTTAPIPPPITAHVQTLAALEAPAQQVAMREGWQEVSTMSMADLETFGSEAVDLFRRGHPGASAWAWHHLRTKTEDRFLQCLISINAGLAHAAADDLDRAQDHFIEASQLRPASCLPMFLAGVVSHARGRYRAASWMFEVCLLILRSSQGITRCFGHLGFPFMISEAQVQENKQCSEFASYCQIWRVDPIRSTKLPHLPPFGYLLDPLRGYEADLLDSIAEPSESAFIEAYRLLAPLTPQLQQIAESACSPSATQPAALAEPPDLCDTFDVDWSLNGRSAIVDSRRPDDDTQGEPNGRRYEQGETGEREEQGTPSRFFKGALARAKHWIRLRR